MNHILKKIEQKKMKKLKCPDAPKITIKPIQKKIPYINAIRDEDSSSDEQYETPNIKYKQNIPKGKKKKKSKN